MLKGDRGMSWTLKGLGWTLTNRDEKPLSKIVDIDGKWTRVPADQKRITETYEHKWVLDDYEYIDTITISSNHTVEWETNYEEPIVMDNITMRTILERMEQLYVEGGKVRT